MINALTVGLGLVGTCLLAWDLFFPFRGKKFDDYPPFGVQAIPPPHIGERSEFVDWDKKRTRRRYAGLAFVVVAAVIKLTEAAP